MEPHVQTPGSPTAFTGNSSGKKAVAPPERRHFPRPVLKLKPRRDCGIRGSIAVFGFVRVHSCQFVVYRLELSR